MATAKSKSALSRMKVDELVAYAMEEHGLVIDTDKEQKEDIIQMILDAQKDEGLNEPDENVQDDIPEPAGKAKSSAAKEDKTAAGERRRWVKIYNDDGDVGDKPVFIGCNGDEILVKRNQWAHMKQKHINVLKAAKETHFRDRQPREVPRYRFEVQDEKPEDAELAEG